MLARLEIEVGRIHFFTAFITFFCCLSSASGFAKGTSAPLGVATTSSSPASTTETSITASPSASMDLRFFFLSFFAETSSPSSSALRFFSFFSFFSRMSFSVLAIVAVFGEYVRVCLSSVCDGAGVAFSIRTFC